MHIITNDEIIDTVKNAKESFGIEGVTFLGGEPLIQNGIYTLSKQIGLCGLGTILFTGYKYDEVAEPTAFDMIIDGEFDQVQFDGSRNLIGSKNQRIIDVSGRYKNDLDWFYVLRNKGNELNVMKNQLIISGDIM